MGISELQRTVDSVVASTDTTAVRSIEDEASDLVAQIAAQDAQIAQMETEVRDLPQVLQQLICHPVLWLLLGREGVDRPGGDWSTLVGQQVVTIRRIDWRLLMLVGVVMLMLGVALGVAIALRW